MKVVFDTNVLISGFLTVTGISQHVFAVALKRHTVILSHFILKELKRKLIEKLHIPESQIESLIRFLRKRTLVLDIPIHPKIQFRDKKDIPILSLVEASGAHYFVTGDKRLLELKKIGMTLVLNPREALEVL